MILKKTVLILGAGASSHLGYPIGSQLLNQIVSLHGTEIFKNTYDKEKIRSFQLRLSRYGCYSIDEFLEKNREFLDIGKGFIAYCLNKYEIENELFPPNNSGWYQYLFNRMRTPSIDHFADNKITFITFNYDRSLEAYLHNAIRYHYNISEANALDILKKIHIIHPHGILGIYPEIPYSQSLGGGIYSERETDLLQRITNEIKIIHEIDDSADAFSSKEYELSNIALQEADKIYFLGFGFHEDNVRRFRFFTKDSLSGKEIYSTSRGFVEPIRKRELMQRLAKYGFNENLVSHPGQECHSFFYYIGSLE